LQANPTDGTRIFTGKDSTERALLEDKETMKSIKQAEKDVKAGRVRDYYEFLKELKQSGEI
jgi:hypothetical protein